jgi:hypothetical protein
LANVVEQQLGVFPNYAEARSEMTWPLRAEGFNPQA